MGWCHEFGPQIHEGCGHPMQAGATACSCPECGVVCEGRFNGCPAVWARGPASVPPKPASEPIVLAQATGRGRSPGSMPVPDFSLGAPREAAPPPVHRVTVVAPAPVVRQHIARPIAPATDEVGLRGLRSRLDGLRGDLLAFAEERSRQVRAAEEAAGDQS